jgi:hypothetical protein
MLKKLLIALLILVGFIFSIFLSYRLLRSIRPVSGLTEIERVFPGGEVAFVKTEGFINVWNLFKDSDYYRDKEYRPLLTIPGVYEISEKIEEVEEKIGRDVNFDFIMYLLGDESAAGFYVNDVDEDGNGNVNVNINVGLDYLVVSRVYPEILFVERLATFFAGEKYITESNYLGLIVKEIKVKEIEVDSDREKDRNLIDSREIIYALDGDFLILSGDRALFNTAVEQYIDKKFYKKVGGLSNNKAFIEAKERVNAKGNNPYIFGFVDLERLKDFPSISEMLFESEKYLSSDELIFNAIFDVGDNSSRVAVELELRDSKSTTSKKITDRFFEGGSAKTVPIDDAFISMSVNDLYFLSEAVPTEFSPSEKILLSTAFRLFNDGFSLALVGSNENCPGLSAWGKSPPGAMKILTTIVEKNGWAIIESEIDDLKMFSVVETVAFGPELMVFAFNDGILFVGDRGETVTSLVKKVKVEKTFFERFRRSKEGLRIKMMPGPLWESIERCPTSFESLMTRFFPSSKKSLPFKKRVEFVQGLYPVEEFGISVVPGGVGGIKIEISADFKQSQK